MIPDIFNIAKLYKATGYALMGLVTAFRKERAFQQEIIAIIILAPLALWLGKNGIERALLLGSLLLVLIVELVNTAVETLVERISPEWHELSGHAKDIAGAAVLLCIITALVTWVLVLAG